MKLCVRRPHDDPCAAVRRMPCSPLTLPDIDAAGGGAERAFHVLAGGFLELRNVRVRCVSKRSQPMATAVMNGRHTCSWLLRMPRTTTRGLSGVCEAPLTPSAGSVLMRLRPGRGVVRPRFDNSTAMVGRTYCL